MARGPETMVSSALRFMQHVPVLLDFREVTVGTLALTALVLLLGAMTLQQWRGGDKKWKLPLPPGSLGLPFLGETLSFISAQRADKPERFFLSRAAKYGKVFKSSLLGWTIVSVDAPYGNKFIFSNDGKLLDSFYPKSITEILGKKAFAFQPHEEHRRMRRIVMTCLGGETLQSFVPRMEANVFAHLAEYWEGKEQVMAARSIKHFAFKLSCDLFLSLTDSSEMKKLEENFAVLVGAFLTFPINLPGFQYHKSLAARASILSFLDTCIDRRREELRLGRALPNQDLLSVLLTTPDENGEFMADNVIKDNLVLVMTGGYDTSSNTMTIALKYLAENPTTFARILKEQSEIAAQKGLKGEGLTWKDLKEMKYTWHVLQETTRLHPQLQAGFREAIADIEYEGYTIPKGWKMIWSANRSHKAPEFFPDPDKFDPTRFEGAGPQPYTYLAFGSGSHTCPGSEYARIEMLIYLHYVVTRFQWSLLYPEEPITINPSPIPKWGLPLKISPRMRPN